MDNGKQGGHRPPQGKRASNTAPPKPNDYHTVIKADEDDMCPNCVTPWKCNGPHIVMDDPGQIAYERYTQLVEEQGIKTVWKALRSTGHSPLDLSEDTPYDCVRAEIRDMKVMDGADPFHPSPREMLLERRFGNMRAHAQRQATRARALGRPDEERGWLDAILILDGHA